MINGIIISFIQALKMVGCFAAVVFLLICTYGLINRISERNNHYLKKIIKAQNNIISSLCNSRNR